MSLGKVIFLFLILASTLAALSLPFFRKLIARIPWLSRIKIEWSSVQRTAALAGVLSLWVTAALYVWQEQKKDEEATAQYQNLTKDFLSGMEQNLGVISYVTSLNREMYRINSDKLFYLDTYHVKRLLDNSKVSGTGRATNLIKLNSQLSLFNEKISLMKSYNVTNTDVVAMMEVFIKLGNIDNKAEEIRSLYRDALIDLGAQE